ncbi:histamine H2 receptor-like [Anopheles ziemanni]|uniref:histamine H2 receptor-like n=1 Tax=Anopheles coustani TaxID=139045 RepID=UPI0026595A06|nr:histamine H2 receptor-like [Anopheles coustani]XP_058175529.1 histamine H2 receptor-like [Anopheles ziemanni]
MASAVMAASASNLVVYADRVNEIHKDLVIWIAIDGILMVCIFSGNILTIIAVWYYRRLQWLISNLFVLSLAISDIFVGLTLPYHLAFYMGVDLGRHKHLCLLRFFVLIIACSVSIWNLIAIAVDRYIAICYPLHYTRLMTKRTALTILGFGWSLAISIATIPLIWNKWDTAQECEFDELLHPWYVAGVITPIFSVVWLCLFVVYWRIWREASKHAKQLRAHGGALERSSDWKSVQVVLLIMGCFTFCWIPYFVVILTQIFAFVENSSPTLYKAAFSLAMANSMMNPIIYAWKNTHFRHAFKQLLTCHKPVVPNLAALGGESYELDGAQTGADGVCEADDPAAMVASATATFTNHSSLASLASTVTTLPPLPDRTGAPHHHDVVMVISQPGTDVGCSGATIRLSVSPEELSMPEGMVTHLASPFPPPKAPVKLVTPTPAVSPVPPLPTHIIAGNIIINNFNLYDQARMERLLRCEWTTTNAAGCESSNEKSTANSAGEPSTSQPNEPQQQTADVIATQEQTKL